MDTKEKTLEQEQVKIDVVADEVSVLEKELDASYDEQAETLPEVTPEVGAEPVVEAEPEVVQGETPEPELEVVKAKPETVPLATFLETKKRLKELEQREAERLSTVQAEAEVKVDEEPTSVADLIRLGLAEKGGLVTTDQLELLETNRAKKQQREQRNQVQTMTRQAENQFRASLSPDVEVAGLGVDDVITDESVLNLTLKDQTDINNTPFMDRPKLIYDKCIARNPDLKAKYEKFQSIQRKKTGTKTMKSTPIPKKSAPSKTAPVLDSEKTEAQLLADIEGTYD